MTDLNPKQAAFVREYLVDLNATQAAIRAGYAESSAKVTGHRLLTNANVAEAINQAKTALAERHEVSLDMVVAEWVKIGFAEVTDVVEWGATVMVPCSPDDPDATLIRTDGSEADFPDEPEEDREPQPHGGALKRTRRVVPADVIAMKAHTPMALVPSSRLSKAMRGAIAEVKETPSGLAVKMHDKMAALAKLYDHLKPQPAAGNTVNLNVGQLQLNLTQYTAEFDELLNDHLARSEGPSSLDS